MLVSCIHLRWLIRLITRNFIPQQWSLPMNVLEKSRHWRTFTVQNPASGVEKYHNEDNEIGQVPRGHGGPVGVYLIRGRQRILGHQILALPLYSPHSAPTPRSQPCTSSTTLPTGCRVRISRPRTGGGSGTRHHRLDSVFGASGQGRRTLPTRECSPSIFVGFVNHVDGESGVRVAMEEGKC